MRSASQPSPKPKKVQPPKNPALSPNPYINRYTDNNNTYQTIPSPTGATAGYTDQFTQGYNYLCSDLRPLTTPQNNQVSNILSSFGRNPQPPQYQYPPNNYNMNTNTNTTSYYTSTNYYPNQPPVHPNSFNPTYGNSFPYPTTNSGLETYQNTNNQMNRFPWQSNPSNTNLATGYNSKNANTNSFPNLHQNTYNNNNNYYANNQAKSQKHNNYRNNHTQKPKNNQYMQSNRNYEAPQNKYQNNNVYNTNNNTNVNKNSQKIQKQARKYENQGKKLQMVNQQNYSDDQEDEQEDQEQIYQKTKQIVKKRDPVLDSPQEIRKWIQARKRNYPKTNLASTNLSGQENKKLSGQMSILQSKIRKRIMIINADSRGVIKKLKNMHILKRIVGDLGKNTHINKKKNNDRQRQKIKSGKNNELKTRQQKDRMENENSQIKQEIQIEKVEQQNSDQPQQIPICKVPHQIKNQVQVPNYRQSKTNENEHSKAKTSGFTPEQMIKHLKQKQEEDKQFYGSLLNYKTNSLNYKYSVGTLETNFVLEDIFQESSYLLQIIRYIIKNDYFDKRQDK